MSKKLLISSIFLIVSFVPYSQCIDIPLMTVIGEARIDVNPDDIIVKVTTSKYITLTDMNLVKDNLLLQMKFVEKDNLQIVEVPDLITKENAGFLYTKEFVITVHDFKTYFDLAQKLIRNGFNTFKILDFRVLNLSVLKEKARLMAVKNAKEKATSLASEMGQAIGKAHRVEEIEVSYNSTFESEYWKSVDLIKLNDHYSVNPGFVSVIAKLKVSFDLKK